MEHQQTGELNNDFRTCLSHLMENGLTANPRGTVTKELLNYNISLLDARNRVITFPDRKTNLKYLLGEFVWYLTGANTVNGILPYSKFWANITNSGDFEEIGYAAGTINSNYGYRLFGHDEFSDVPGKRDETGTIQWLSQWEAVIDLLSRDKDSRQAILNIHRPSDRHPGNSDVPCTLSLQVLIRENKLHMITNMRSNDIVLGFTNDVFQFTMLQECLMVQLKDVYPELELGTYFHNAGSMHAYDRHFAMAAAIIADENAVEKSMIPMDEFNLGVVEKLAFIEQLWVHHGMPAAFDFAQVPSFNELSPYWQNLVKFCFSSDPAAELAIFK